MSCTLFIENESKFNYILLNLIYNISLTFYHVFVSIKLLSMFFSFFLFFFLLLYAEILNVTYENESKFNLIWFMISLHITFFSYLEYLAHWHNKYILPYLGMTISRIKHSNKEDVHVGVCALIFYLEVFFFVLLFHFT